MQLKETMKLLRQAEREERTAKGVEAKKAKLMEVEVPPESQAADEDMAPGHRGEDESPNKKQRVEHTVSHVIGDSEVEVLATNEEMEPASSAMAPTGTRMTASSWSPLRSRRGLRGKSSRCPNWTSLRYIVARKFLKEYAFGVADGATGRRLVGCTADTS